MWQPSPDRGRHPQNTTTAASAINRATYSLEMASLQEAAAARGPHVGLTPRQVMILLVTRWRLASDDQYSAYEVVPFSRL